MSILSRYISIQIILFLQYITNYYKFFFHKISQNNSHQKIFIIICNFCYYKRHHSHLWRKKICAFLPLLVRNCTLRARRDEQRERKILFLRYGMTPSPLLECRSEFSIPLSSSLRSPALLTRSLRRAWAGRSHSVIRRRDGFTSWLVALLRDAEIEFIIRRYYTAACLQRLNRI